MYTCDIGGAVQCAKVGNGSGDPVVDDLSVANVEDGGGVRRGVGEFSGMLL
jgi:hypothetical protein